MRMVRASLLPRIASLIRSCTPIPWILAKRLCGMTFSTASPSCSASSSAGTAMPSLPASTARTMTSHAASNSDSSGMPLGFGGLRLLDDALGQVRRDLLVVGELEREVAASAGHRAQVGRVAEHLGHRDVGLDDLRVALRLGTQHLAAAAVQVADDVAHVLVGHDHADRHDGLEQHRLAHIERLLEAEVRRDLERHLRRVDVVVRAVVELHLDVDDGVAGEQAPRQQLPHALLDRGDEVPWDDAADDRILELEALAAREGRELDPAVAVLPVAARLTLVLPLCLRGAADRLLVGHLRRLQLHLDAELPLEALDG